MGKHLKLIFNRLINLDYVFCLMASLLGLSAKCGIACGAMKLCGHSFGAQYFPIPDFEMRGSDAIHWTRISRRRAFTKETA